MAFVDLVAPIDYFVHTYNILLTNGTGIDADTAVTVLETRVDINLYCFPFLFYLILPMMI